MCGDVQERQKGLAVEEKGRASRGRRMGSSILRDGHPAVSHDEQSFCPVLAGEGRRWERPEEGNMTVSPPANSGRPPPGDGLATTSLTGQRSSGPTGGVNRQVPSLLPSLLPGIHHMDSDLHKCPTYPGQEGKSKPEVARPPRSPPWRWE